MQHCKNNLCPAVNPSQSYLINEEIHSSSLFEFHASKVSGLVFVCLGVSCMPSQDSEWSCMFGSIIYVLYLYVWEYHLCLVFVCLGVSFMSCICMFGSIIYVLYLHVWEYHLCLVFVCLGYHCCLVFVCLGVSFMSCIYMFGVSFMSCICMFGVSFMSCIYKT
jgi:hypothetical protein